MDFGFQLHVRITVVDHRVTDIQLDNTVIPRLTGFPLAGDLFAGLAFSQFDTGNPQLAIR